MQKKQETPKPCLHCNQMMERKRFNGTLEDMGAFNRRKFCSLACAGKREELTKHGYSWRARKHLKESCEACGHKKSLHAHHIDQNSANNEPENIQTLCKHCHDFWHTTQKRVGLKVAGRMPQLIGGNPSQTLEELPTESSIGFTVSKDWVTRSVRSKPQPPTGCLGE